MTAHSDYMPQAKISNDYGGGEFTGIQARIMAGVRQFGQSSEGVNIPFLCSKLAPEGFPEQAIRWVDLRMYVRSHGS